MIDGLDAPMTGDGCRADCTVELCGDGILDPQETCDDGNKVDGDCCSAACAADENGTTCDDADACTHGDACLAGVCQPGAATVCPTSNDCHEAVCDAVTGLCSENTRPPIRPRASSTQIRLPAPERDRAAASPAAPAPMMATSYLVTAPASAGDVPEGRSLPRTRSGVADDLVPGKPADQHHLLVDLPLRGAVAEDAAEVFDFRGDEAVVLRQEPDRSTLEIAFRDRNELRDFLDLQFHDEANPCSS